MQFAFLTKEINEMLPCLSFNGQISTKKKKKRKKKKKEGALAKPVTGVRLPSSCFLMF